MNQRKKAHKSCGPSPFVDNLLEVVFIDVEIHDVCHDLLKLAEKPSALWSVLLRTSSFPHFSADMQNWQSENTRECQSFNVVTAHRQPPDCDPHDYPC